MKGYQEVRVYNAIHPDKNICAGGELGEILRELNQIMIIFESYFLISYNYNPNLVQRFSNFLCYIKLQKKIAVEVTQEDHW